MVDRQSLLKRRLKEEELTCQLKTAEKTMFANPSVRRMIAEIRDMWREDDSLYIAFGATAASETRYQPPKRIPRSIAEKTGLPASRIPQLLELLSQLQEPMNRPQALQRLKQLGPNPLLARHPLRVEAQQQAALELNKSAAQPATSLPLDMPVDPAAIEKAEREVAALKIKRKLLEGDREAILARRGEYALPSNRLRAERLLRELPGEIDHLEHRIRMMREGML